MTTVVIGDNTGDDFSGTEDTYLHEQFPTAVYDGLTTLQLSKAFAGSHRHLCLSFSGLSNLPAGLTVSSAAINLYLIASNTGGDHTSTFNKLLRNWVETQATWNNWKTGSSWTTGGALSNGNDKSATSSSTMVSGVIGSYYTSTDTTQLQSDIEDFVNGSLSNYGWHIERTDAVNDGKYKNYSSIDDADGQRPYLTVVYTTGGPSFTQSIVGSITTSGNVAKKTLLQKHSQKNSNKK